jgi:hypothetical protein
MATALRVSGAAGAKDLADWQRREHVFRHFLKVPT